ncbi:hypothetical protein ARSEF4850_008388 [Beauveria asiatica]
MGLRQNIDFLEAPLAEKQIVNSMRGGSQDIDELWQATERRQPLENVPLTPGEGRAEEDGAAGLEYMIRSVFDSEEEHLAPTEDIPLPLFSRALPAAFDRPLEAPMENQTEETIEARSTVPEDGETVRVTFKILEKGEWIVDREVVVDAEDPSEVQRLAIKYLRRDMGLFSSKNRVLAAEACFDWKRRRTKAARYVASNHGNEREPTHQAASFTPPDHEQTHQSPEPPLSEPTADCPTDVLSLAPLAPLIRASTLASLPAPSRTDCPSPDSQPWDIASTQTSCTSVSAVDEAMDETDTQKPTETYSPDESGESYNGLSAPASTCDQITSANVMRRARQQLRNKRRREASQGHDTEQSDAEELHDALSDVDKCQLTGHENEEDSEGQSSDEDLPSRKRRKRHIISRRNRSMSKGSASFTSAAGDKVAGSASSALPERADNATDFADAAFDEWVLQDVVLQRTIINGKASFHFQFDWDSCMNHGEESGKICKTSSQQGRGRTTGKSNGRRKFTADEEQWLVTWKETQGLCWADIHQRFCDKFEERSKESLQVRR